MREIWQIGYTFYPHESLVTESFYFLGTKKQAKAKCLELLNKKPLYVQTQVDKNFESKSHIKVFCSKLKIIS